MSDTQVHDALPIDKYFALPGVSATALKDILVSPLLYAWRREYGRPDRDTLRVGRATHTAILEPHRFPTEYVVWDGGVRRGKAWDAFRVEHEAQGRTILTETQRDIAITVGQAVRDHRVAAELLARGRAEISITWQHERTGLACKSRLDWLGVDSLVDVKTCRDPAPALFSTQAARLGHHLQMAFYSAALATVGVTAKPYLIAAQNVEPWDVVVYEVPDEVLVIGEQLYEAALDKVVACTRAGNWPGIAEDAALTLRLPEWAMPSALDDELTIGGESLFAEET